MSYASRLGRARISSRNPQAAAVCDRCGTVYNHVDLSWQNDWAGATMVNKRILVCNRCLDVPQMQLRAITLPADPVPIQNPRPFDYVAAETDFRVTMNGEFLETMSGENRVPQQTGAPNGSLALEPGTDPNAPGNDDPGLPYLNTQVPKVE